MAYFQRKGLFRRVVVYYYSKGLGKSVALSRAETKHLDKLTDAEINRWLRDWERQNEIIPQNKGNPKNRETVNYPETIKKLFTDYQREREVEENVGKEQLVNEKIHFEKHIVKYFIETHGRNVLSKWGEVGGGFRSWLTEHTSMEPKSRKAVILTLNRFGRFLVDMGKLKEPWDIRPPKLGHRRLTRSTPLPHAITPEQVLRAAKVCRRGRYQDWALALLVGYFGSLRPEETMALTIEDFLTGLQAEANSQTLKRFRRYGLGSRLAVQINKALVTGTTIGPAKNYNSNGIVTIWHSEGAKAIAEILKTWEREGRILRGRKDTLFKTYRKKIKKRLEVTLHDLRRASALYLGREIGVEPFLLQDHMRHADLETTMLYTRRPKEGEDKSTRQQNFDDVV